MARPIAYQRDRNGFLPIEGYGIIGNGQTVALVGSDASIDWLCFPRIDSPSTFGRLLDAEKGGYWQIVPVESWSVDRHYIEDSNVLVTRFTTSSGTVEIVDLMPSIGFGASFGIVDRLTSGMVVRIVRGTEGTVKLRQDIVPAFNYGRDEETFELVPGRGALVRGTSEYLSISCTAPMRPRDGGLITEFELEAGEEMHIIGSYHPSAAPLWLSFAPGTTDRLLNFELQGWRTWINRCTYNGPYSEHVRRSALTLKLLDYLPSGATAAAATTSLPEDPGGIRNWDYRYAWIRDTSYAIYSFLSIGYREEAESFFQWVVDATNMDPTALQIMYRVEGERELPEFYLEHFSGYRHSRPVRVGNEAYSQRQHDVWGELLDAAHTYRRFGGVISEALWDYLVAVTSEVLEHWREPDSGIWEVRNEPRRTTSSNVMCWVALDRAIKLAKADSRKAPIAKWERTRDQIRAEVLDYGVSPVTGTFVQSFGGNMLDAAALSFPLRQFIGADDAVMRRTINAIEHELTRNGLVARYHVSAGDSDNIDGLAGNEGHFILTSCWLIDCMTARGEYQRARDLLEKLLARSNDLGLFSEQIDPYTGAHLGNTPQAFSHLGIINTIINFAVATEEVDPVDLSHENRLAAGAVEPRDVSR